MYSNVQNRQKLKTDQFYMQMIPKKIFHSCLHFGMFGGYVQKKMKDSSAPKRPMSAYMLWLNASRDRIKAENPGISVTEILKKAGEMWKQLSKDKKEVINVPFPSTFTAPVFVLCTQNVRFILHFLNRKQSSHSVLKVLKV